MSMTSEAVPPTVPDPRSTLPVIELLDLGDDDPDPAALILTCANCGAAMDERKCKLICRCGYFLSCSDYY
jgi:hypothetical protein